LVLAQAGSPERYPGNIVDAKTSLREKLASAVATVKEALAVRVFAPQVA